MIGIDMCKLHPIFRTFLLLLNTRQIEYLLVGGYAVRYYGYPRETLDLDIWIATRPLNAAKLVEVFQEFTGGIERLTTQPFLHGNRIISLQIPPIHGQVLDPIIGRKPDVLLEFQSAQTQTIEILTVQSGVNFDECFAERVVGSIDGVQVNLISLKHLKALKLAGHRDKDLIDLEHLP